MRSRTRQTPRPKKPKISIISVSLEVQLKTENLSSRASKTKAALLIKQALVDSMKSLHPFKPSGLTTIQVIMTKLKPQQSSTGSYTILVRYTAPQESQYFVSRDYHFHFEQAFFQSLSDYPLHQCRQFS